MAAKDKPEADPAPPLMVRERRQSRGGIGGPFMEERVRPLEPGEPIPDGAQVVEGEPEDWHPVAG